MFSFASVNLIVAFFFSIIIGAASTTYSTFGRSAGPIHLDYVGCRGTETVLTECPSRTARLSYYCTTRREAGVRCQVSTSM